MAKLTQKKTLQEVNTFCAKYLLLKGGTQSRSYGDKGNGNSGTEEGYNKEQ